MSQDRMYQADQFNVSLECGHPNVKPNEECPLCGRIVREKQEIKPEDVGRLDQLLRE